MRVLEEVDGMDGSKGGGEVGGLMSKEARWKRGWELRSCRAGNRRDWDNFVIPLPRLPSAEQGGIDANEASRAQASAKGIAGNMDNWAFVI